MKRRIFSVLIALALCLSLLPVPALAEEGDPAPQAEQTWECGDSGSNVTATLSDDGTLTISGTGAMVNYEKLSTLKPWNDHLASIQRIVIEDGVTSIGKFAFCKHESLTSVTIPDSVKSMEGYAFYKCTSLNSIQLPSGLTAIGSYAFMNCSALTSIDIPSGVTSIGMNAFKGSGLIEVKIPSGVTTIAEFLFAECKNLTRVEIPGSVNTIGRLVFNNAPNAEIYYAGTQQQWEAISIDGELSNKVHTSDSDVTYQVTIVDGGDGFSGEGTYSEGDEVTVSAGTKFGYAFDGWTVGPEGVTLEGGFDPTQADTSFTMPGQDVTLTANWAEAVAEVSGTGYADLQKAFDAAAQIADGGTVKLLKNVTVDKTVKLTSGTVTLAGQGYTLTGTDVYTLNVTGGTLTLENVTVENKTGSSWGINAPSAMPAPPPNITIGDTAMVSGSSGGIIQTAGSLTVNGKVKGTGPSGKGISAMNMTLTINEGAVISGGSGDNAAGISQNGGTLTVNGGTISGHVGLSVEASLGNLTVRLTGGTFTGSSGSAIAATGPLSGLLDSTDYTIYKADGTALTADELAEQNTGSGTFTVGCAHDNVENVASSGPDGNGVVTVTATCTKCSQEVTLGTLTMVGSGKTIIFGEEPPTFEVQVKGLTATSYKWPESFKVGTDQPQAKPAIVLDDVMANRDLEFSCEVTFQTPGGGSSKVTLPFTLKVNPLDISGTEISVYPVPNNVTYDGKEHAFSTSQVAMEIAGKPVLGFASCFDIQLVDASGEAEKRTDAGTYTVQLTGKGCFTGTATLKDPFVIEKAKPKIEWTNTVKTVTYNGQEPDLDSELTVTLVTGETYNKDVNGAIAYSYATAKDGDYTNGLPKNAGTYYIKASLAEQTNYISAEASGTLKLTIEKVITTVTAPGKANPVYNGKPQALVTAATTNAGEGAVQYALSEDGPWSTAIPTAVDQGNYKVYYKVDATANYTGVAAQSVEEVPIIQAEPPAMAGQTMYIQNGKEAVYTLDLNQYAPAPPAGLHFGPGNSDKTGPGPWTYDIKDTNYFGETDVKGDNGVMTLNVKKVETDQEKVVAVFTIEYVSWNFKPSKMELTIKAVNKVPVTISGVEAAGWTYDGTAHDGYTGTPSAGAYTGDLDVAYYKDGTKLDAAPKNAGTYTVRFSVPDSADCVGSKELTFTVEPATVTVRADDKTATVGAARPELTWRVVSGLADGETLKTAPGLVCDADMSKAGTYPITISGGEVPDGGNYKAQIVYQDGTLTVRSSGGGHSHRWAEEWSSDSARHWHRCLNGCSQRRDLADHVFDDEWDTECNVCGYVREAAHRHVWAGKWSSDGTHHWHECTAEGCGVTDNRQKDGYGEHVYDGEWDPECNVCGYVREVAHRHVWAGKWSSDGTHHWHECTAEGCGVTDNRQKDSYGEHVYDNSRDAVCNVCGYVRKVDRPSGGGSGGSGGGTSVTSYRVTVEESEHGRVVSDCASAASGRTVTLTVTPDNGYALDTLTVTGSRGQGISLTGKDGKYTFAMPDEVVTVRGVFTLLPDDPEKECDGGADCPSHSFTDLGGVGTWYHEAVDYVLRNGLMNGYSAGFFGPDNRLTRAQLVQILYNHAGRPAAAGGGGFTDVAANAWCAPAIAWAAERGIAGGYGNGTFGPDDAITREQLAVMLWRYAGNPAAGQELSFHDAGKIGAHAREAICWAVESGVMSGKGGGVLDPKGLATRAQTAQMLKNFLENG